jgi:hypothetical protein
MDAIESLGPIVVDAKSGAASDGPTFVGCTATNDPRSGLVVDPAPRADVGAALAAAERARDKLRNRAESSGMPLWLGDVINDLKCVQFYLGGKP